MMDFLRIGHHRFQAMVRMMERWVSFHGTFRFREVYGVPRGGTLVAIELNHCLPWLKLRETAPAVDETDVLVVDDICDSGRTRAKFPQQVFLALLQRPVHTYPDPKFCPTYAVDIAAQWVEFWWEQPAATDIQDHVLRICQYLGEDLSGRTPDIQTLLAVLKQREMANETPHVEGGSL